MKFSQLIMKREIFFIKSHAENKTRRLVPDFFLFLKKSFLFYKVKASGVQLSFNILNIDSPQLGIQ